MTAPATSSRSNGLRLLFVGVFLAALAGGAGLWYLFLRPSGPAAVIDTTAVPTNQAAASPAPASPNASGAGGPAPAGSLSGTWTVNSGIGKFSDFSGSFVGYRVQEQLASIGAATAVGRTPDVTGTFTLEGTNVSAAQFSAKLAGLTSDERGRDGRVSDSLNTRQFPAATFVLGSPISLGSLPTDGQEVKVTASGKLTIRGVTKDVQFALTTKLSGSTLTVKGSVEIRFDDFGIPKPSAFTVLSIADTAIIEVQLQLTKG